MAFYIRILKTAEDETSATFRFEDSRGAAGTLRFSKADSEATLVTPMPGDDHGNHFVRAVAKLRRAWDSDGALPEKTEWAS